MTSTNGNCCATPSRRWSPSTPPPPRYATRWNPIAATTNRSGGCCASRSAPPHWWCPRNTAVPAALSVMRPSCSKNSARVWCPARCSAPRWPNWHCWPQTNPIPRRWVRWPRALRSARWYSIADYVINGDVADIVIARRRRQTRAMDGRSTPSPSPPWTRPGDWPRITPESTAPLGTDPGVADAAAILLAAEQIGAAARCLELTVDYTKERQQFGRPIGSFQALKHRMADLYVAVHAARAVVNDAADAPSPTSAALAHVAATDAFSTVAAEAHPAARRHRDHLGTRHAAVFQTRAWQFAAAGSGARSICAGSNPKCSNVGRMSLSGRATRRDPAVLRDGRLAGRRRAAAHPRRSGEPVGGAAERRGP